MTTETATFAGGCFWGVQKYFKKKFDLKSSEVGYVGGAKENPSYKEVCTGTTGHAEAVQLKFDPSKVKYEDLVRYFFQIHDPTTKDRQGNDKGTQYRSAIFFHSNEQKETAEKVLKEIQENENFKKAFDNRKPVTEIVKAAEFFTGEEYHQNYLDANPGGYCNHKEYFKL
eukprot:CAMPEP_0168591020 /NCGR_PEP_ID=MMETSP0420-20121227/6899_1 /TAXON_ID=498008 /ORGANISM="Pessonella sp." /LENGTH=169 /DNA_ID=CAMNT_0008626759 /DNA_START=86 /DNA_END=595 /DNA_ORIENTATION=-